MATLAPTVPTRGPVHGGITSIPSHGSAWATTSSAHASSPSHSPPPVRASPSARAFLSPPQMEARRSRAAARIKARAPGGAAMEVGDPAWSTHVPFLSASTLRARGPRLTRRAVARFLQIQAPRSSISASAPSSPSSLTPVTLAVILESAWEQHNLSRQRLVVLALPAPKQRFRKSRPRKFALMTSVIERSSSSTLEEQLEIDSKAPLRLECRSRRAMSPLSTAVEKVRTQFSLHQDQIQKGVSLTWKEMRAAANLLNLIQRTLFLMEVLQNSVSSAMHQL